MIEVQSGRAVPWSVIIPTKNRPEDPDLTVESILEQTCPPLQVVIVDQSEGDDSALRVRRRFAELRASGKPEVLLSYIHDATIPSGAIARNRAMDIAKGDIWLFLDDDVQLEPDFLEELRREYQEHPEASGVSGIITNYPRPAWAFRVWSAYSFCARSTTTGNQCIGTRKTSGMMGRFGSPDWGEG